MMYITNSIYSMFPTLLTLLLKPLISTSVMFLLIVFSGSCMVMNELDLNPGHVSGVEVKEIIHDRMLGHFLIHVALVADYQNRDTPEADSFAEVNQLKAIIDYRTSEMLGIKDTSYYKRKDVVECADAIYKVSFYSWTLNSMLCDLQEDDPLYDP